MSSLKAYITIGDFYDVYHKIREKGFYFVFSKLRVIPSARISSKWNDYKSNSDFWLIPEVQQRWNKLITGNPTMLYEDYVVNKYFSESKELKMLSIGCGDGYHDRNFAKYDCFSQIDAIDFSKKTIDNAVKSAKENNLNINYFSGDFKSTRFENEFYDLILFNSSLHHFSAVEQTLRDYVKPLLNKNGILVVFEYCGPKRLQWTDEQIKKSDALLKGMPEKFKYLYDGKSIKKRNFRPGILRMLLVDPSEAVDSQAIVSSLKKHFKTIEHVNLGWNILHILLKGISQNFINDKRETKELLKHLFIEEDKFLSEGNASDAIFGIYKK